MPAAPTAPITTPELEQYQNEIKALTAELKAGPKTLISLPKNLQEPEFLAAALESNRIQVGRPDHSWERSPGMEEHAVTRPIVLKVSKTIGWTSLNKTWEKTIFELLAEEEAFEKDKERFDPRLRLQVKLSRRTEK
jgi:hypothetical protein